MFTGIILAVGKILTIQPKGGDFQFKIATGKLAIESANLGDSIAVNGVCLTAVELGKNYFCADISNETLSRTLLKSAQVGTEVNLELALTPSTRMGGHIVSGHVDGLGVIIKKQPAGRCYQYQCKAPDNLAKYIAEKGSICINGVSLTINEVQGSTFTVNIVPHTLQETTLGAMIAGTEVNLEVDLLARYMERLMQGSVNNDSNDSSTRHITETLLQQSGFIQ